MSSLATKHWEPNTQSSKIECRIEWVHEQCLQYFIRDGLQKQRQIEEHKLSAFNNTTDDDLTLSDLHPVIVDESCNDFSSRLDLLDVGSCYNPFEKFPLFSVLPIDIAPGHPDVKQCDFLHVKVTKDQIQWSGDKTCKLSNLAEKSFAVVIFSLLLEYFPDPELRFKCCSKACKILKTEGLLFIITPDSKHATANAPIMKKWRLALATIGFWRVSYEKLKHLHCMAFRKCRNTKFPLLWAEREAVKCGLLLKMQSPSKLMIIPQDSNSKVELAKADRPSIPKNIEETVQMFGELPSLD